MGQLLDRRTFLSLGGGTAIAAAASPRLWGLGAIPAPAAKNDVESKLDAFTTAYMKAMNAPGMTQALTDKTATIRTAGYGYANVELKTPVSPDQLFQIGSITKSFTALIMLQLRDEGKVDLHRPVLEYLPWLPVNMPYGEASSISFRPGSICPFVSIFSATAWNPSAASMPRRSGRCWTCGRSIWSRFRNFN